MMLIVIQYIGGCPNSEPLLKRTREAIAKHAGEVQYSEVIVQSNEDADKIKFRGSPTLLINNQDFEGLPEIDSPGLACRYYANGLPTVEEILAKLNELE
jgi:hypothetical protein